MVIDQLTVFSTPACQQCRATYRALDDKGIDYKVVDISDDLIAHTYVTQELGYTQAPVVVTSVGEHWSGFRPDLISALQEDGGAGSGDLQRDAAV